MQAEWDIRAMLQRVLAELARIENNQTRFEAKLNQLIALVQGSGQPDDLQVLVKGNAMKYKMQPKGGVKPSAVMPPVTLTTNSPGLELVVVDANGAPIGTIDPTAVTTTLTADQPSLLAITPGADPEHYTATIPAGATGTVNVSATLAFNAGTPGPFTSSIALTLPTPPAPVPTDLQIVILGN